MSFNGRQRGFWHVIACLVVGFVLFSNPAASAEEAGKSASPIMVPNPAIDLWRTVRQRDAPGSGITRAQGVEAGVLIDSSGEDFRNFRRQDLIGKSAMLIGAFAVLILVFYVTRGCIRIPGGRSGNRIKRFATVDRTLHWATAILFIIQAITGLLLLFGRFAIIPLIGADAFSVIANAGLFVHNWLGPLFFLALLLLIIRLVARNIPKAIDIKWLARGGGAIGEGHVSAGFFNGGEKIWFWAVVLLGITASVTGLILDFPVIALGRETMQLILIVHAISAVLMFTGSLAHIYIGTIGSEGSLESMTTGYVDENWAEAHHDLWYAEATGRGKPGGTQAAERQDAVSMQAPPDRA